MATVQTDITPTINVFPLTGYQDIKDERSSLARAVVEATTKDGAIALTGAGDNQYLIVTVTLPRNYAYAILEFQVGILGGAAATNNFGNNADLSFQDAAASANRIVEAPMGAYTNGSANVVGTNKELKIYKPWELWHGVLRPATSAESVVSVFRIYNETANDAAYTVDVAARFLQYDISQAHHVAVNSPIPVR